MKEQWFDIQDLDEFVRATRTLVYTSFGSKNDSVSEDILLDSLDDAERSEMDQCLSQQESLVIVEAFMRLSKNKKRYRISDRLYFAFIEALNARMVSNILNKLSRDGLLESAFDEKSNDFIFWVKEDEK